MRGIDATNHGPKADLNSLQLHCRRLPALPHVVCNSSKGLHGSSSHCQPLAKRMCCRRATADGHRADSTLCRAVARMQHQVCCPLTSRSLTQASALSRLTAPSRCCSISRLSPVRASAPEAHSYSSCSV